MLFQEEQFSNTDVSSLLKAEDILSKLDISCLGKSFCEMGFHSKGKPNDEISIAIQESIR